MGYTGTVDTITILKTGLYRLYARGAAGGSWAGSGNGPAGGISSGYKFLKKGTILYACVGGQGSYSSAGSGPAGGFNGGGDGRRYTYNNGASYAGSACSGGGASHIATISGTISAIGASRKSSILIVAGGGGGGNNEDRNPVTPSTTYQYGRGGGVNGTNGIYGRYVVPTGGSQSSGGLSDAYGGNTRASFGQGGQGAGSGDNYYSYGGGGGLYGGGYAQFSQGGGSHKVTGGGGSGYIGGVPTITYKGKSYAPSTGLGTTAGHGQIQITLVEKGTPTIYYGDKEVDAIYYGDKEVDAIYYGDKEIV